jgi:predicted ATPase/class 3 adenylate cyclase/DNA-binding CsgD family transcriptional regulator
VHHRLVTAYEPPTDPDLSALPQTGDMADDQRLPLPTGTVTFLLTDIEGSTRLWESRDQEEMGAAVARHYVILDEAICAAGGRRPAEQGEGDSVVAAFSRCGDAVRAAVAAQRALASELPWLRVRMAIHTGDAQLRGEDNYVGRAVIRAARLRSCGHGGQIVLSASAAALAADDLDDDVTLADLGVVALRNLSRPEHAWQVLHRDLAPAFPPLRAPGPAPAHLPLVSGSFVGRERELVTVAELVRSERLVTLTGSGGCGKTRLAVHVAADVAEHFADGVRWVDLAPLADGRLVVEPIAASLGLGGAAAVDGVATVVSHLRGQGPLLLVLDNAEHLVEDVARVVEALRHGCPSLTLLVTSREPLALADEHVFRVPSLAAPAIGLKVTTDQLDTFPAARLFLDRARHARPNLVVDERTAPCIAAICARLDGIPLAIELAAARARTLPLDHLAAGLDDSFRLLTGGARTALPRQQTLAASIAWSVDLLDPMEQAVLRRLSVFRGPFTLDAAEAVAADGATVDRFTLLDAAGRLVDKSLLQLDDETGCYRLLETIRQFGLEGLRQAGELRDARDRHCHWHADFAATLKDTAAGFDEEGDAFWVNDVLSAFDWACDNAPHDAYRITAAMGWARAAFGYYDHLRQQYEWIAARDDDTDPAWCRAVAGLALVAWFMQRDDYLSLAERALRHLDDDTGALNIQTYQASVAAIARGDAALLEALRERASCLGHRHLLSFLHSTLAVHQARAGYLDRVDRIVHEVDAHDRQHDVRLRAAASGALLPSYAICLYERGRFAEALAISLELTNLDPITRVINAGVVGVVAHATADASLLAHARTMQAGAEVSQLMRASVSFVPTLGALIDGDWPAVVEHGRATCTGNPLAAPLRSFMLRPLVIGLLAHSRLGDVKAELDAFRPDTVRLGFPLPLAHLHQFDALVARHHCDTERTTRYALDAARLAMAHGYALLAVDALELMAEAAAARDHEATAARLFGAADAERRRLGYVGRFVPEPGHVAGLVDHVRTARPDAFAEGATFAVPEAIELAARGRGDRGRPAFGWAGLTPTEWRVTELVSDGLSNERVGAKLLMSVSTVKTHLTHIYAKTGTANRTELGARFRHHLTSTE